MSRLIGNPVPLSEQLGIYGHVLRLASKRCATGNKHLFVIDWHIELLFPIPGTT